MKKALGAVAIVMLVLSSLRSQPALRVMTSPKVPPRQVLDRLNLTLAWAARLPTGGHRDGLFTLQLIPAKNKTQLVVETIFGNVFLLDAETGDTLWRTPVGIPNWSGQPIGYNEQNLFVIRRDIVHILDRATGVQRYYTLDKNTKLPNYGFTLPAAPSAAPSADEYMMFFCLGHRVEAYLLPDWSVTEAPNKSNILKEMTPQERQAILDKTSALPPLLQWSYQEVGTNIEQPVLITPQLVTAVSTAGNVLSLKKFERSQPFEFQTNGNVAAPMGQHGLMAYIGSEDYTLYALNLNNQRLAWRFLASAPILLKPEVTDRDVFVSGHRKGLYRVDRATGQAAWLNQHADRFLSTNQKYVYALDRTGLLLVLDYARGTTLAQHDMRDWLIPVPNELSDRFYLANHDGQIVCLRNRAEVVPLKNKTFEISLPKSFKKMEKKQEKQEEPKDVDNEKAKEKEPENDKVKEKDNVKDKDKAIDKQKLEEKKDKDAAFLDTEPIKQQWERRPAAPITGRFAHAARMGP